MKALLLSSYRHLELADLPTPQPGPGEVLIRVAACGICGSDVHGYDGSSGRRIPPLVMGHEAAGTVAAAGAGVTDFAPGDRLTFDSTIYCGQCPNCCRGDINLCDRRQVHGMNSYGDRFEHGSFRKREMARQPVADARRDRDKLGEGSGAAVVCAGNAENLAAIAKIDVAAKAIKALAAINRGIEGHPIAFREIFDGGVDGGDCSRRFVAHYQRRDAAAGGAVVAVHIAAADAAGGDSDEHFTGSRNRGGHVGEFKMAVA